MFPRRRRYPSLFLLACMLPACGSMEQSSSPDAVASEASSSTLAPSLAAADVSDDGATPPPGAKDAPAAPHDAPDLEALIPDAIAQFPLTKSSTRADPEDINMVQLASRLGIQVADIAFAHATTTSDDFVAVIEATRVDGADAGLLRDIMLEASAGGLASEPSDEVVAGKEVVTVASSMGRLYLYASGNVLYAVTVLDTSVAAEVLAAIPSS